MANAAPPVPKAEPPGLGFLGREHRCGSGSEWGDRFPFGQLRFTRSSVFRCQRQVRYLSYFAVLSHRIGARREDLSRRLERRFATGLAWWVVQSRLQTGAPLWLRLRRAMSLRLGTLALKLY